MILKITFHAKYVKSNASQDKNTKYFTIYRKNKDAKCKEEDISNPRVMITFSLGLSVYTEGVESGQKCYEALNT